MNRRVLLRAGLLSAARSQIPCPTWTEDKIADHMVAKVSSGQDPLNEEHDIGVSHRMFNLAGLFFMGQRAFRDRHEVIFKGPMRGTTLQQEVVSLRFLTPDVAICETMAWVLDFKSGGAPPYLHLDGKGRLRTRLLQVMTKRNGEWQIVVYHNVDIKPNVDTPEPQ